MNAYAYYQELEEENNPQFTQAPVTKQTPANPTIKFQKHYVTNGELKARVHYSAARLTTGQLCVNLYAKSYQDGNVLGKIFSGNEYENESDVLSDYMEKGRARIFETNPLYTAALDRAQANLK